MDLPKKSDQYEFLSFQFDEGAVIAQCGSVVAQWSKAGTISKYSTR
jgi:hypothetical protein